MYSKSLSKAALNFYKDFELCPSYSTTPISRIWGIKVFIVSSQTFFPSHPPSMAPLVVKA